MIVTTRDVDVAIEAEITQFVAAGFDSHKMRGFMKQQKGLTFGKQAWKSLIHRIRKKGTLIAGEDLRMLITQQVTMEQIVITVRERERQAPHATVPPAVKPMYQSALQDIEVRDLTPGQLHTLIQEELHTIQAKVSANPSVFVESTYARLRAFNREMKNQLDLEERKQNDVPLVEIILHRCRCLRPLFVHPQALEARRTRVRVRRRVHPRPCLPQRRLRPL